MVQQEQQKSVGTLFLVSTPIGHLEDITHRAVATLAAVDVIACEDQRVTKKLLARYHIATPTISYHHHKKTHVVVTLLLQGKSVAYVTDAGTPGISDPGNMLVADALAQSIPVFPIPGPSALTALLSIAGIDMQKFVFLGFPPHKKGRETFFKEVAALTYPVIYYESPYRVLKNLALVQKYASHKKVIVGRELTKMFEETVRGSADQVMSYFQSHPDKVKGEFTLIVH